jgi:hypothetical protein
MKFVIAIVVFFFAGDLYAQDTIATRSNDTTDRIITICEQMPYFPGGENAFQNYLSQNIHWPDSATGGTAYVRFVIEGDGSVSNVTCVKGDPYFCAECVRVVGAMPKWVPGWFNGKPARVEMVVPIRVNPK